uniref:Uncharacterized protein n=1 Tax=Romanomermis culicivorax TaxID=13658 RepID=A0A915JPH8_ROMCU
MFIYRRIKWSIENDIIERIDPGMHNSKQINPTNNINGRADTFYNYDICFNRLKINIERDDDYKQRLTIISQKPPTDSS